MLKSTWPEPVVRRKSRPRTPPPAPDVLNDYEHYHTDVVPRKTDDLPRPVHQPGWVKRHAVALGGGMLIMLALWIFGVTAVIPFAMDKINHWNCGAPPGICQYDIDVGHGGTSHFMTQYWHGEAVVIEMKQAKPESTTVYAIPMLIAGDMASHIVTITTAYVSHFAKPDKPDLLVQVPGVTIPIVLYNTGDGFSTAAPKEVQQ